MGALPKRKISKSRRDRRRGHDKLKKVALFSCDDVDGLRIPHRLRRAAATEKGRKLLGFEEE